MVAASDKESFFSVIELENKRKLHNKTKEEVIFPHLKESFYGAIRWDDDIALMGSNKIFIIDLKGKLLSEVKYENNKVYSCLADFSHHPCNSFAKEGEYLYQIDSEFNIKKLKIKK